MTYVSAVDFVPIGHRAGSRAATLRRRALLTAICLPDDEIVTVASGGATLYFQALQELPCSSSLALCHQRGATGLLRWFKASAVNLEQEGRFVLVGISGRGRSGGRGVGGHMVFTAVARFRAGLDGIQTPVVVWPEHFDLSTLWFRTADRSDSAPQLTIGFAPFDGVSPRPYLYATGSLLRVDGGEGLAHRETERLSANKGSASTPARRLAATPRRTGAPI